LEKQKMEPPVRSLLVRVARLGVFSMAVILALDKFGVNTTSLVAGIGVAGVGIGLALQGVLGNIFAGLTIIFTKPFRVGEYIELLGVSGQVTNIELTTTKLLHADRSIVTIPNHKILGEILHNYGGTRQLALVVGVGYQTDLQLAVATVRGILAQNPRVLKDPVANVGITALGDSAITLTIQPWVKVPDYGAAQLELYEAIVAQFRAEKIEIPYPQRDVRLLGNPPAA
jgi:small conductance mechanosensitive channel